MAASVWLAGLRGVTVTLERLQRQRVKFQLRLDSSQLSCPMSFQRSHLSLTGEGAPTLIDRCTQYPGYSLESFLRASVLHHPPHSRWHQSRYCPSALPSLEAVSSPYPGLWLWLPLARLLSPVPWRARRCVLNRGCKLPALLLRRVR